MRSKLFVLVALLITFNAVTSTLGLLEGILSPILGHGPVVYRPDNNNFPRSEGCNNIPAQPVKPCPQPVKPQPVKPQPVYNNSDSCDSYEDNNNNNRNNNNRNNKYRGNRLGATRDN